MQHLPGFAPLGAEFDGFILDLWGVVHDGIRPTPGATDCLERLRGLGKRVVMLSNAPRRASAVQASMRQMGIADELYTDIMTSGEAVHRALRDRPDAWWRALGRRVFHLGPERDLNLLHDLDLVQVAAPAEAEFVLNTGPDDSRDPTDMAEFEPVLRDCAAAVLPMICANPDLEVIRGGVRVLCAGSLAQRYLALGGVVRSLGKPDPAIYAAVIARLNVPTDRILAVGDSLRTDIAGAAGIGVASCWVLGGLHLDELGGDPGSADAALRAANLAPLACLSHFTW